MPNPIAQILSFIGLGVGAFLLLSWLQFSNESFAGTDAYYHSKIALLMFEQRGAIFQFPWLPKTVLDSDSYVDHHFLFHVFLAPFASLSLLNGTKFAVVVLAVLAFYALQTCLPPVNTRVRMVAGIAFFAISPGFIYRMLMVRAQGMSLVILLLIVYATINKRYVILALLGFVYVWAYNAFPLVAIVLGAHIVSEFVFHKRIAVRPLWILPTAVCAGVVVNPYFPRNIVFLFHHLIDKFSLQGYAVSVGNEWYPYSAAKFMQHAGVSLGLMIVAAICCLQFGIKRERRSTVLMLFVIAGTFLVMLLKSRRFIELYPPFALLFSIWAFTSVEKSPRDDVSTSRGVLLPVVIGFLILVLCFFSVSACRDSLRRSEPYAKLSAASGWLKLNTPKHSLVLMSDWDLFTKLFHFNHHNTYIAGLDPYFFYAKDPSGFLLWRDITRGQVEGSLARLLKNRFGSEYVLVERNKSSMIKTLSRESKLKRVFSDKHYYIYKIVEFESE